MKRTYSSVLFLSVLFSAVTAFAAEPAVDRNGVLADNKGMTLYTFKKDTAGTSTCYDGCAKAWPPFLAKPEAKDQGDFSVVSRNDGARQWAYRGQPLYYFAGDAQPGDASGQNSGGVWFTVQNPAGKASKGY